MSTFQMEMQLWKDPEADEGAPKPPGFFIEKALASRGWSQVDLAKIIGRPIPTVNEIINGKRGIMPEMAIALGGAFGEDPSLWAHREAAFRIHQAKIAGDSSETAKRAALYEAAPIKDLEKRGWIPATSSLADLESRLVEFFGNDQLCSPVKAMARKSDSGGTFSAVQNAWLNQARRLAEVLPVSTFTHDGFMDGLKAVRKLAANTGASVEISRVLGELGVRFVIIEQLPKSRIDGAAFWLDESSPVVALSLRHDRIDSFWHTLAHEIFHIVHRDSFSVDVDIVGEQREGTEALIGIEKRADSDGANWLIPQDRILSFLRRHRPYISAEKIALFAARMGVAPGIAVGQMHHLKAFGYKNHRKMLTKIRDNVVSSSISDGFGQEPFRFKTK